MGDRMYFRQLLSGRDFARDDMIARQMVNFTYVIGDRERGEAVVVDPAYGVDDRLRAQLQLASQQREQFGFHYRFIDKALTARIHFQLVDARERIRRHHDHRWRRSSISRAAWIGRTPGRWATR